MKLLRILLLPLCALAGACDDGDTDAPEDTSSDVSDTTVADSQDDGDLPDAVDAAEDGSGDATDTADTEDDADTTPVVPRPACMGDEEPGTVTVFYDGFRGSEGIAFGQDGLLYVTADKALWRFDADGTPTQLGTGPSPIGLAPADGGMWMADLGVSTVPAVIDGSVWFYSDDDGLVQVADGIASPNFALTLPDGSVLVSDDFDTRVWRVTRAGDVSEVLNDIASPNGLAYSPDRRWLYVASTFTPRGEITRFSVGEDGLPDGVVREEIAELGRGSTPDGVAVDADGVVWVAANLQNQIVGVDPEGEGEPRVLATRLGTPASLAFGNGPGFDPCSVYVTQLFGSKILRVRVGVPGAPL